jgi:photosynthetic reaction center cytochrome c subunit
MGCHKKEDLMDQRAKQQLLWKTRTLILVSIVVATVFFLDDAGRAQTSRQPPQPTQPAEKVFKNIQVLTGMPAEGLQGAMSFIASSLGVDCDFCHRQDKEGTFASDVVPAKVRAREMIRMVRRINQETFHGDNVVNCFTCHQGSTKPVSIASVLLSSAPRPVPAQSSPSVDANTKPLPSVQKVLDNYVQALGGQAILDQVKTRVVRMAPLTGVSSESSNYVLFQKAPGKVMLLDQSEGYTLWVGFNGQQAWAQDSFKSYWGLLNKSQLHSIMRDSELYQGSRLRSQYENVAVTGEEKIGDRDTYVIAGTSPEGARERFYFDARTGLLSRRHIEEQTTFGWFPLDVNFEAYREVDGIKMPFVVRFSSAGDAWGVRTSYVILEVHQNVPVEDEVFDHPTSVR